MTESPPSFLHRAWGIISTTLVVALILVACALVFVYAYKTTADYADRGIKSPPNNFQPPGFKPGIDVNVTATLSNGPVPGDSSYFGTLEPYTVVSYQSPAGDLEGIRTEAWVYPMDPPINVTRPDIQDLQKGVDLCPVKELHFTLFDRVSPVDASNRTTNVTYASQSYVFPWTGNLPNGDQCATRFRLEGNFTILLCAERDGQLEPDEPTDDGGEESDRWDFCATFQHFGRIGEP